MTEFEGNVEGIVFRNEQNGWTVLNLKSGRKKITAVGVVPVVSVGDKLKVTGDWVTHPDYGKQLKIQTCESARPSTQRSIEKYLGSGAVKGLGPATAKLIVQMFKAKTLEILDEHPERIMEIEGIGKKRAEMIIASYSAQRMMRQSILFLQQYGIGTTQALKIHKALGENTVEIVRSNPYILADKVKGIGFKLADDMAMELGIQPEDESRIRSGILYTMEEAVGSNGHTYLPMEELYRAARYLLAVDPVLIENGVKRLCMDNSLVIRQMGEVSAVYLQALFFAENDVAKRLSLLRHTYIPRTDADSTEKAIEKGIDKYESENEVQLGDGQREAVRLSVSEPLCVITGGPGTGKTTGIRCILDVLGKGERIELCAPTGRAAKRMSEATGRAAKTIHRLLEYSGDEETFVRNEEDPLDADTIIVDEMSMIDIFLMRALLRAIKPGARLIMVGDADQLPSVGAGNVLRDLCESGVIPLVHLHDIFRQAQESMIVVNAHKINQGEAPVCNGKHSDFFFERALSIDAAQNSVLSLVTKRLPTYLQLEPTQIQVISPMKKGDLGVWELNRLLQVSLNPKDEDRPELMRGDTCFRLGDKVMQTRNNYQLQWIKNGEDGEGVFNGDLGVITELDQEDHSLCVTFDDERVATYVDADLEDLELAYCLTVHKSQGSEFPCVVIPLLNGPAMLFTRNLLYTAVTRARKLVVLVGKESCVMQMIGNTHIAKRYSGLISRLQEAFRL